MAGELKLNNVSVATESGGTVTIAPNNITFAANHAGIKTALNASGNAGVYAARAWVNFNGTGTISIRSSGNVSSLVDDGTGIYTVNFTTAMPDPNYAGLVSANINGSNHDVRRNQRLVNMNQNQIKVSTGINQNSDTKEDHEFVTIAVFR